MKRNILVFFIFLGSLMILLIMSVRIEMNALKIKRENSMERLQEILKKTRELGMLQKTESELVQNLRFYEHYFLFSDKKVTSAVFVMERMTEMSEKIGFEKKHFQVQKTQEGGDLFTLSILGSQSQIVNFFRETEKMPGLDFSDVNLSLSQGSVQAQVSLVAHTQEER